MTKILNIIGGPGAGKSLTASGVFYELKRQHIECELVSEFAKELVWEGSTDLLENQLFVFSEQFRKQYRLLDKVEYVITDSPLLLSKIFLEIHGKRSGKFVSTFSPAFLKQCLEFFENTFKEFDNEIYYLSRQTPFSGTGRNETMVEAINIDGMILTELSHHPYDFINVPPDQVVNTITKKVLEYRNNETRL